MNSRKAVLALSVTAAAVVWSSDAEAATTTVQILHTNDSHSRVFEGELDGMGFAKLSTLIEQEKDDHSLLVDSGDTFHGTTFASLDRGEPLVQVLNELGYDALVAGNHDFNYGLDRLMELTEQSDFPVLGANVQDEGGEAMLEPYTIHEVNGTSIGLFGLATPETAYKTNPENVADVTFADPSETAEEMVAALEEEGADVIVALAHLGVDKSSTYTSEKVAEDVEGIDVIVDGHSHTTLEEGLQGANDTLIASAGEYLQNFGVVELQLEDGELPEKTARLISQEEAEGVEPDPEIETLLQEIETAQDEILADVVGKTAVELNGEREAVRVEETNLGNWIADVLRDATGADISLTNGGGIRASIAAGEITKGDLVAVSPFGNFGVTKEVTGAQLVAALENGVKGYPEPTGGFPQIAGFTFQFDPEQAPGNRVHHVEIDGEPLEEEVTYLLATNDFLAAGGDEYDSFAQGELVNEYSAIDELLIESLEENGEIAPEVGGRIETSVASEEALSVDEPDAKEAGEGVYTIQPGDTLFEIGLQYNMLWTLLVDMNPSIQGPDLNYAGEMLYVTEGK
ncbi:5'-nucleotidase C-terminal domain-containing protein [Shouchella shacheensis]|uniref:5'-nucleotidase C-terminal domain-containing protein n=1 Tax=Shouchella shacheensis TaxID=1649580 RepID=UPI00073FF2FA|nr:5'-nucleotidase C-terminal domain-containing protein [Shouchella shacheensis]